MSEKIDLLTGSGERKYVTPEERQAFIAAAKRHPDRSARTFCSTLAHTGCRISEALELNYRRVDLAAGHIVFRSLKKRGKLHPRAVPVPPDHLDSLELVHGIRLVQKRRRKAGSQLWDWSRSTGWRRVCEVMEIAGIKGPHATPKGLRHGFGVHAMMKDIPLPLVQRWMGRRLRNDDDLFADCRERRSKFRRTVVGALSPAFHYSRHMKRYTQSDHGLR